MEQWGQFGVLVALFLWVLKRIDSVKSELTKLRDNDFVHLTERIDNIQRSLIDINLFYRSIRRAKDHDKHS